MDLLEHQTFERLTAELGVRPHAYKSNLEAMEAVEIMATARQLGDQVLGLARGGRLARERAEALLLELVECFTRPVERAKRVIEIGKQLRGHEG